jgi:DNA-binding transcriptional regulator YiaG
MARSAPDLHEELEAIAAEHDLRRRLPPVRERRRIREAAGVTVSRASRMIGVSDMAVSYWERGQREPRGKFLERYVALLEGLRKVAG